jgi:hypothetical protein
MFESCWSVHSVLCCQAGWHLRVRLVDRAAATLLIIMVKVQGWRLQQVNLQTHIGGSNPTRGAALQASTFCCQAGEWCHCMPCNLKSNSVVRLATATVETSSDYC